MAPSSTGGVEPVTVRFTFTKLMVGDLASACTFYREVFGLQEAHRIEAEIDGTQMEEVFFATDVGAALAVVHRVGDDRHTPGEVTLGFATSDIDALFERASRAGATVRRSPHASEETRGHIVGILADPEGHLVEVIELRPEDGEPARP